MWLGFLPDFKKCLNIKKYFMIKDRLNKQVKLVEILLLFPSLLRLISKNIP